MENPIKMDDLGVPRFSETSIYQLYKNCPPIKRENISQQTGKGKSSKVFWEQILVSSQGTFYRSYEYVDQQFLEDPKR